MTMKIKISKLSDIALDWAYKNPIMKLKHSIDSHCLTQVNETIAHQRALKRWICQIYNSKCCLSEEAWQEFAKFCEQNNYTNEPPPGQRVDGRNSWDVFEESL